MLIPQRLKGRWKLGQPIEMVKAAAEESGGFTSFPPCLSAVSFEDGAAQTEQSINQGPKRVSHLWFPLWTTDVEQKRQWALLGFETLIPQPFVKITHHKGPWGWSVPSSDTVRQTCPYGQSLWHLILPVTVDQPT